MRLTQVACELATLHLANNDDEEKADAAETSISILIVVTCLSKLTNLAFSIKWSR